MLWADPGTTLALDDPTFHKSMWLHGSLEVATQ
jgi:hypothetical protein